MSTNRGLRQHIPFAIDTAAVMWMPLPPEEMFDGSLLDVVSGEDEMAVNGSVTPVVYRLVVPEGKILLIDRFTAHVVNSGIEIDGFCGLAALTNGFELSIHDENGVELYRSELIQRTYQFVHFGNTSMSLVQPASGDDQLVADWHMHESFNGNVFLLEGQYVEMTIADNLSGLTHMEILVTGRMIDR